MPPHKMSKVLDDFLMTVPFLEVGFCTASEHRRFASACSIVTMQLASDDSMLASCGQLVCVICKLFQLEPFRYQFQLLIVHFRVIPLGSVVEPDCHVEVLH